MPLGLYIFISRLSLWMQTGVRGRLSCRALSEFPSHGIMQTRAGYKMVPSYDLGDLGLICKYCSFKGFVVKICLLQWSQWACSASHQITIWLKIHMRVWSRICYLLNFYFHIFFQRMWNPQRLCCLTAFPYMWSLSLLWLEFQNLEKVGKK